MCNKNSPRRTTLKKHSFHTREVNITMLSVQSISKVYGQKHALSQVSFELQPGEIVALLGANGSGKTTTVQSICRLLEFEHGDILFEGQSVRSNPGFLRNVGAVLDGSRNTNWRLTAGQNAEYFARLRGVKPAQSRPMIAQLQDKLGLSVYRDKEVMKLSTGNKQKAALLCALAYTPKLLLLDEPTLGLDMQTVSELQDIIVSQARDAQQGFLITSHDLSFIDQICTRVVVLDQGKVIFNGLLNDLKAQMFHYELRLVANAEHLDMLTQSAPSLLEGKWEVQREEDNLSLHYDNVSQVMPVLAWLAQQTWTPASLQIEQLNVEKAYRSLTQQTQTTEAAA